MSKFVLFFRAYAADEAGATMVEYAIMGGLAASLLVLAVLGVSDLLADAWAYVAAILLGETPFAT
jgi:Flp pilus assembly pilin Flp